MCNRRCEYIIYIRLTKKKRRDKRGGKGCRREEDMRVHIERKEKRKEIY